jgi:hypothetical protein
MLPVAIEFAPNAIAKLSLANEFMPSAVEDMAVASAKAPTAVESVPLATVLKPHRVANAPPLPTTQACACASSPGAKSPAASASPTNQPKRPATRPPLAPLYSLRNFELPFVRTIIATNTPSYILWYLRLIVLCVRQIHTPKH